VDELFLSIRRPARRLGLSWGLVLGALASATQPVQAGTLTIIPTFDSTITSPPNAAQIEAAINSAIGTIDGLYSTFNTVTDNVYFQLGPGSFLARTNDGFFGERYTSYTNALKADSTANPSNTVLSTAIANLSKGNASSGASRIAATTGLLRMLGFTAPPCFSATGDFNCGAAGHPFDSIVTLSTTRPLDYTRPTPAFPPTEYDALGAIEHELDEVVGGGGAGSTLNEIFNNCSTNPSNFFCNKFGTLDLYRYSAPNTPSFTTSGSASSYFSVDGGVTNIVGFNQSSGGDFADFGPNVTACSGGGFGGPDAFIQDAFSCNNQQRENYTTASPEYSMLLSIGYDPIAAAAVPEPGTLALLGTSLLGFGAVRRRQRI
jgi:PEP-CTERM motif-containing protein